MSKEIISRLINDLSFYSENNLKIKPKTGEFQSFSFNRAQQYIHSRLEEQKEKTGKVRAVILKGRQQGCSTYVGARYYHNTVCNQAVLTFIFAHDADASSSLFDMVNNFYTLSDESFRPELGASNAKELLFPRLKSGYKIGTAGTRGLGRSKTFQQVHWSEVAYSPNCSEHATGILQTVADAPGTEIILESTANGQGDFFHRMCMQALSDESDWQLIFVPWYWQEEYTRELPDEFALTAEESDYLELYSGDGLTKEHLSWRRHKILDLEGDEIRFKREYPFNPQEAFQASDENSYIKADAVIRARKSKPVSTSAGLIIGVDPAREGNDKIVICHRVGRNITKYYRLPKMDTSSLSNTLAIEINKYKPAKMFIDVGGLGVGVYDQLVSMGYGQVATAINFGAKADNPDKYYNKRAEMYGLAKLWLEEVPCSIDESDMLTADALQADLTSVGYSWTNNQQLKMESKEAMRKRGLPSPDYADAFVLTFAQPVADGFKGAQRLYEPTYTQTNWSPFD